MSTGYTVLFIFGGTKCAGNSDQPAVMGCPVLIGEFAEEGPAQYAGYKAERDLQPLLGPGECVVIPAALAEIKLTPPIRHTLHGIASYDPWAEERQAAQRHRTHKQ